MTNTPKVGVGFIGCGAMGGILARLLLKSNPQIEARAFCDPNPKAIEESLKTLNPNAKVYRDYRALCEDPGVDWVMIASWNCFHKDHAVAALECGKDVFCQKPLATNLEDCLAMRRAWKRSGRQFVMGFNLRYTQFYRKLHQLIAQGAIGEIISMDFNETIKFMHGGFIAGNWRRLRKNAGTHLLEKCCHDIDLVNWIVGSPAVRAASFGGNNFFIPRNKRLQARLGVNDKGVPAYGPYPGSKDLNPFTAKKDIVDNQVAIIEYANGVRAAFHVNMNAGIPERRMYIVGAEGALRADLRKLTIEVGRIGFDEKVKTYKTRPQSGHGGGDAVLARELGQCMLKGAPPMTCFDDGLKSAIVCFAIDQALDTGKVVSLAPYWRRAGLDGARQTE